MRGADVRRRAGKWPGLEGKTVALVKIRQPRFQYPQSVIHGEERYVPLLMRVGAYAIVVENHPAYERKARAGNQRAAGRQESAQRAERKNRL